jgi:hypothetical protein
MGLSIRDRSMSWLTGGARLSQDGHALNPKSANMPSPVVEEDGRLGISPGPSVNFHPSVTGGGGGGNGDGQSEFRGRALTINLPSQPTPGAMFTMHQARTPGWQTPWTPRNANPTMQGEYWNVEMANGDMPDASQSDELARDGNPWVRRRKRVRAFFLNNVYVPLVCPFSSPCHPCGSDVVTHTYSSSGSSISPSQPQHLLLPSGSVRSKRNTILLAQWAVLRERSYLFNKCAPWLTPLRRTLVIIFAPLTLVHVLAAIYVKTPHLLSTWIPFISSIPLWQLEYFGRPLGLWRTSHKLAHTLFETTFICAWSAALSLCFDNFFTSYVPCASISSIKWYNELPRPASPISDDVVLGRHKGGVGDQICDDQLVLIVLVGIGLIMYCTNLVISLFRIFERVKGHKHGGWSTKRWQM